MKLFGFEFKRAPREEPPSFVPEQNDDGAAIVSAFGAYGTIVDLDGTVRTEAELITKYREMSLQPEIDEAIENIVTEAIVQDDSEPIVQLELDEAQLQDNIKEVIQEEFENILKLIKFNTESYDIFKRYYVDGRLYYHTLVDPKAPQEGIQSVRYIDPRKMRKVREIQKVRDKGNPDLIVTRTKAEYYIYNESGFNARKQNQAVSGTPSVQGLKISKDAIVHITSGVQDASGQMTLGHLHKAIKPMNQLRALEDAVIIYRISRAPERRIFYIDVGNLPKAKAEQHLRDIMVRHKNKLNYDAATGEVTDQRRFMTMLEDYWLPRRGDGKATEITTLPAGQNLGEMTDVEFFQKRLYKSLNVPITRLDPERAVSIGRATEITRDEIKFSRFIDRLRMRFSNLFLGLLEKQLILKMIIAPEEWDLLRPSLKFKFARDNYFAELKDSEVMMERMNRLRDIDPYAGIYYSRTWIRERILKQTAEDIERIDQEIAAELEIPQYNQALMPQPMDVPGFGGGAPGPVGPPPGAAPKKKPK
jgi:hypothetical protein